VLKLKRIFAVIRVIFQLTLAGNHSLVASTILESKLFRGEAEKSTFLLLEKFAAGWKKLHVRAKIHSARGNYQKMS
jgi:hypothetical protein